MLVGTLIVGWLAAKFVDWIVGHVFDYAASAAWKMVKGKTSPAASKMVKPVGGSDERV